MAKSFTSLTFLFLITFSINAHAKYEIWHNDGESFRKISYDSKRDKCIKESAYGNNFPRENTVRKSSEVCQLLKSASENVSMSGKCESKNVFSRNEDDRRVDMKVSRSFNSDCQCTEEINTSYSYAGEYSSETTVYILPISECQ